MRRVLTIIIALVASVNMWAQRHTGINHQGEIIYDYSYSYYYSNYNSREKYSGDIYIPAIADGVTLVRIHENAFQWCPNLTSVSIPSTITKIDEGAFDGSSNLTFINVDTENQAYCSVDGVLYNKTMTTLIRVPEGKQGVITIPETVTAIGSSAFNGCNNITISLAPSNTALTISNGGLYNKGMTRLLRCLEIKNGAFHISNGVVSIETGAFCGCQELTSIYIPNSVKSIGKLAFAGTSLSSIDIPNSVTKIEGHAFSSCSRLESITLSNNLKTLYAFTFEYCSSLKSIALPNTLTGIEAYAFNNCTGLRTVIIPSSVKGINSNAFWKCENITIYTASNAKIFKPYHQNPYKRIIKCSPEKLKYYYPFSAFAKEYVEKGINEWQKKGEFERTADYQKRVNEETRKQQISLLLAEAEQDYNAYWAKENKINLELGKYDADNEVFVLSDKKFGTAYLAVPYDEAPDFKSSWGKQKINYRLEIKDDKIKLAFLSVVMPNGKEYTYRNTDAVNYNLAEAEYNFDPIDLTLASAPKAKQQPATNRQSDVDTNIPGTNDLNPNTFVIIFANEDYKNVASVPYAKNDGAIFQKYCQKTLGVPVTNIHYVENASYNDIRIQLAWLKDVCDAFEGKASMIIYYAGHGIPDETDKSAYLLPVDGDGRYVQSAYKLDDFYQKLGAMNAQSITVFMDACFSGSKRENGMLTSARGIALKSRPGQPQGNMVVFSAASNDETAYPNNDEQHGLFTYFLLRKLQETKGNVTLQALGDYITTNVRQESIVKNGKSQTPTVTAAPAVAESWQTWKLK